MIKARIIADSISPTGKRITTFVLKYHRYIHPQILTHRVFSRNSASSRAIPIKKVIKQVWSDPAMPVFWGANQPGMRSDNELAGIRKFLCVALWILASKIACCISWLFKVVGLAKQYGNRPLEPFLYTETIVTATELGNFYNLRLDIEAQREIYLLTKSMLDAQNENKPNTLNFGEWHLPYVNQEEIIKYGIDDCLKFSVARCARVTSLNHDNTNPVPEKDIELYNKLRKNSHMSPFEHQATPSCDSKSWSGNFQGWNQYRKLLDGENKPEYSGLKK
jgi:hypothetical protein